MVNPFDLKTALLAKHAQHVVLIHFPIGLFLAAVAFDLIALWTKRRGLADAAYYNLLAAAISTLPVLATVIFAYAVSPTQGGNPVQTTVEVPDPPSFLPGIKATQSSYHL